MKPPKMPKPAPIKHVPRSRGSHAAFGAGGDQAFRDPATMVAPDQAFTAAMAMPQGGAPPPTNE